MKVKKILAIGTLIDSSSHNYSGQAMMFDGLCTHLKNTDNYKTDVINIATSDKKRTTGKFSIQRCLDYIIILLKVYIRLLTNRYDLFYLTTAQSKIGFIRDAAIIYTAKIFNVPVVAHQFGANYTGFYDSLTPAFRNKVNYILGIVKIILVEGNYMKDQFYFLSDYQNKVKVIPNGLPGNMISLPYQQKSYSIGDRFELVYLSNMILSKGYMDVLYAVDLLKNKYNRNINCTFIGRFMRVIDDPSPIDNAKESFFDFVKKHNLEEYITYHEGAFGDKKREVFLKSNVFLLPSYFIYEGQPVSIIEAMAYGNIPIVTHYRHIPDMVNSESGCFVLPKQPEMIAQAVILLMDSPGIYSKMSGKNINIYRSNFTFEKYCSQVLNYL